MRQHRQNLLVTALGLLLAACSSSGAEYYAPDGRHLRDAEPAPYRIAVSEFSLRDHVMPAVQGENGSLPLAFSVDEMRDRLVEDMHQLNAASAVFAVDGESDVAQAVGAGADLLLRPRVTAFHVSHDGASGNWLLSTSLWLFTWIGGLLVDDSNYQAQLQVEWEIVNTAPADEHRITRISTSSSQEDLAFWDRHSVVSAGTLQTFILPPVITFDSDSATSEALCDRAVTHVAAQITQYLKSGLDGQDQNLIGRCRIDNPRNGATVTDPVTLDGVISARDRITSLTVAVNDETVVQRDGDEMPSRLRQKIGNVFEVDLPEVPLALRDGDNVVAIAFEVDGVRSSRTLMLRRSHTEVE